MFSKCARKGVTLGGNHVMSQAMQDVRRFLTTSLDKKVLATKILPEPSTVAEKTKDNIPEYVPVCLTRKCSATEIRAEIAILQAQLTFRNTDK